MKKIRLLTILSFILGCLLVLACCGKTKLATPDKDTFLVDQTTLLLSWEPIKNAKGYKVIVNNEEFNTTKPRYPLDPLPAGEYTITVQAVGLSDSVQDSTFSEPFEYIRAQESGLSYALINNNTEYEVRSIGTASGHIKIDDTYRGRPVTSIADMAFANKATSGASIEIGNNIRKIGSRAFLNCSMIQELVIPESVTEIGAYAFQGCRDLGSITLPDTISKIDSYTFAYCRNLETIEIPDSVTSIGTYAFASCDKLNNVVIPDSVETLGEYAFTENKGLTTITLGDGLETISQYAFLNCEKLLNVTFGKGLKTIDKYAFSGCSTSEEYIDESGLLLQHWSIELPDSLESIGLGAFIDSTCLTEVDFGSGLQSIGNGAFMNTAVELIGQMGGDGFTFIDGWVIKYAGTAAPSAFPEGTVGIADFAFVGCDKEWSSWTIAFPNTVQYIGTYAFYECKLTGVEFGTGMIRIDDYAFAKCTTLRTVTIKEGLKEIGKYVFQACEKLKYVYNAAGKEGLPTTLERIGVYAFDGTDYWTRTFDGPVYIGNWLVGWETRGMPVETVTIKPKTVGIADWAFYGSEGLTTVNLPESIQHIGEYAFAYCASLSTIILRPGITTIKDFTFYQCMALSQIEIPSTVTSIGYSAFNKCYALTSVTIPLATKTIDDYAFFKCTALSELTFETEKTYVQKDEVTGVETTVTEKGGTETIGERAFYGCIALTDVTLPNTLEELGTRNFYKCTGLKSVTFTGDKLAKIEPYTFYGCTALESVVLPVGVKSIGDYAFRNCAVLKDITLGEGLTTIGRYAFYGCAAIETLQFPNSLTTIQDYAFRNCDGLKSVVLPASITTIGKHVFNGANNATFYTEYAARPTLWIGQWNTSYRPVVWGCTLSQDKSYVVSFTKTANSITDSRALNGMNAPVRAGYEFAGWATSEGGSVAYTMENIMDAPNGTTLYAVWN